MATSRRKDPSELRQFARLAGQGGHPASVSDFSPADIKLLVYEFGVYQAELLAQNEELRELRQQLERALATYAALYDNAPVGYATLNPDGRVVNCNLSCSKLLDHPRATIVGTQLRSYLLSHHREDFDRHLREILNLEEVSACELALAPRPGLKQRYVRLESRCVRQDDSGALECFIAILDVTERKLAEEALRRSEQRLKIIADHTAGWESLIGTEGELLWVNPAVEKLTGYTETDCRDMANYPLPMIHDEDRDELRVKFEEALVMQKAITDKRFRLVRKDGRACWMSLSCLPVFESVQHDRQSFLGLRVSARDITARVEAELLKQDIERITHHDLRSPMIAVHSGLQLLERADNLNETQLKILEYLGRVNRRGLSLLDNSITLSRIEANAYALNATAVNLHAVAEGVIDELADLQAAKRASIALGEDAPPLALGDPLLCHSMLVNLLRNALEALPGPGMQVKIELFEEDGHALMRIGNPGAVPEDIRHRFFGKYATSGKANGTGLGAYSSQLMAKAQGGSLTLDASFPGYTAITLRLPLFASGGV